MYAIERLIMIICMHSLFSIAFISYIAIALHAGSIPFRVSKLFGPSRLATPCLEVEGRHAHHIIAEFEPPSWTYEWHKAGRYGNEAKTDQGQDRYRIPSSPRGSHPSNPINPQ